MDTLTAWGSDTLLAYLAAINAITFALFCLDKAHHKTRKPLFYLGVPAMLIVQAALLAWLMQG